MDSNVLELRGDQGRVTVTVLGYERPDAENTHDANWLVCEVAVQAGPFSGSFRTSIETHAFARLEAQTRQLLLDVGGQALFATAESSIRLKMNMERTGRANVSGVARCPLNPETSLEFFFGTDQTLIQQAEHGLRSIVQRFPIKN